MRVERRPIPGIDEDRRFAPHPVRRQLLDRDHCAAAAEELIAFRSQWIRQIPRVPFFTFGAASYLDAVRSPARYLELAARFNPLLRAHFGWLLDEVSRAISRACGVTAAWHPHAALPGFHVYLAHALFSLPVASIHFDKQYLLLDWRDIPDPDFSQPLSFTLPIALPEAGGGLNMWDLEEEQFARPSRQALLAAVRGKPPDFHPYTLGELVIHSGRVLHQVAPGTMSAGDRRMTLQGHGVIAGNRIYLYW